MLRLYSSGAGGRNALSYCLGWFIVLSFSFGVISSHLEPWFSNFGVYQNYLGNWGHLWRARSLCSSVSHVEEISLLPGDSDNTRVGEPPAPIAWIFLIPFTCAFPGPSLSQCFSNIFAHSNHLGALNNSEAWISFPEFVLIDLRFDLGIRFKNSSGGSSVQPSLRTSAVILFTEDPMT